MDEAPAHSLLSVHATTGQDHLDGDVVRHPARQPLHRARVGNEAAKHFRQLEPRAFRHHDDVAPKSELEATSNRDAIHGGDERFMEVEELGYAAEAARLTHRLVVDLDTALRARHLLEVPAGRENPIAAPGENPNSKVRIVAQSSEGTVYRASNLVVDGIHGWPVKSDLKHRPAPFRLDDLRHLDHRPPAVALEKSAFRLSLKATMPS